MLRKAFIQYLYLIVTICFLLFVYVLTMQTSQSFHDAGELQTIVYTLDIAHPTGFPTYVILGKILISIIPFGEVAWKVNFLSIIYSLGVLTFAYVYLKILTKNRLFPLIGVLVLAFCKPFWYYAGLADTHTLNRFFLFLLLVIFLKLSNSWQNKLWFLFCLILGLGLGNHLLLIYAIPGFVSWLILLILSNKIKLTKEFIILLVVGLGIGMSIYGFLPIRQLLGPTLVEDNLRDLNNLKNYITGANFQPLMYQGGLIIVLNNMLKGLIELKNTIYIVGLLVGFVGIIFGFKMYRILTISLLVMFFSFLLFSTNYPTSDPTRYYLSYISIYCLFVGIGSFAISRFIEKLFKFRHILPVIFVFLMLYPAILFINNYKVVNKSQNFEARTYSDDIFKNVLPNSVVISWWNYSTPLWYRRYVLKEREDILIINDSQDKWGRYVEEYIKKRPVYLVEQEPSVSYDYMLVPKGYIYEVRSKN